jgi:FkbM family methyltransferase
MFILPAGVEPDFAFHFIENADSRDEMASFIRLSQGGAEDGLLLDVGAHKGLFSLVHLLLRVRHRAVLLEPSRPLADAARAVMDLNAVSDRAQILTAGAGESTGTRRIAVDALGFARLAGEGDGDDVPFTTIDALCQGSGLVPSLIKIDVEGAEADVVRGARATLLAHRPAICLELHFDEMERRGESAGALLEELASMGYRFESTRGDALPLWRLRRSLMAILRVVAR